MAKFTVSLEARQIHDASLVVDMHVDTLAVSSWIGYDMARRHRNRLPGSPLIYQADLPRMREGGVDVVGFGLIAAPFGPPNWRRRTIVRQIECFHRVAGQRPRELYLADSPEKIAAADKGSVGGVLGIEGCHALGDNLSWIDDYYGLGVRYLTLTHFSANRVGRPAQGYGWSETEGLTDFGREVVDRCNALGMILDLAHVGKAGFLEAGRRSKTPFIVSHTGVRALADSRRCLDDEQIRLVADTGSVMGIIWAPWWTGRGFFADAEAVAQSTVYVMDRFGADFVGIGSDLDGFLIRLNRGLTDISSMPVVTELLLRRGKKPDEIRRVLGENFLRVYRAVHAGRTQR